MPAPTGTEVEIGLGAGGTWHLRRCDDRWCLEHGPADEPAALIDLPAWVAWRQLTGLRVATEWLRVEGPVDLVEPLLEVRGIIA